MTPHALVSNNHANAAPDLEAQQPAVRNHNLHLTRAKIAAMAAVGTAGALATAYLASAVPSNTSSLGGRTLTSSGCSEEQLNVINRWKNGLVGNAIAAGTGIAVSIIGAYCGSRTLAQTGGCVGGMSLNGVVITGIGYAVKKKDC